MSVAVQDTAQSGAEMTLCTVQYTLRGKKDPEQENQLDVYSCQGDGQAGSQEPRDVASEAPFTSSEGDPQPEEPGSGCWEVTLIH